MVIKGVMSTLLINNLPIFGLVNEVVNEVVNIENGYIKPFLKFINNFNKKFPIGH